MLPFDPKFIDASDWQEQTWLNSGGTRAKRVLQDVEGNLWYFKCSERKAARDGKPEKYYKYEFWSEVIAFQLGKGMGLDVLRYDVALHNGELGCISPLMIDQNTEQLIELGRYMTALNPAFDPEDRSTHGEYDFEFLVNTIEAFELENYLDHFLKTMIFDALIGNTDRHQENWAFVGSSKATLLSGTMASVKKDVHEKRHHSWPRIFKWLFNRFVNVEGNDLNTIGKIIDLYGQRVVRTAPIYDSGSSLGRELNEERLNNLLGDATLLNRYIDGGKSELHWEKKKISHFEVIANLISSAYLEQLVNAASFLNEFDEQKAAELVLSVDKSVPAEYGHYCLPGRRKDLMIKLLTLRAQKLKGIIGDGRV